MERVNAFYMKVGTGYVRKVMPSIKFERVIGKGSSSTVFHGKLYWAGVAIKRSSWEALSNEIEAYRLISDVRYIVRMFGYFTDDMVNIVLEMAEYPLSSIVGFGLSKATSLECALDVARGIRHLASLSIVHRDIACRNVIVFKDGFKICDLGMARILTDRDVERREETINESEGVPVRWMDWRDVSYEKKRVSYSLKSDVWSFGVFVWELYSRGEIPFHWIAENVDVHEHVKKGNLLATPKSCDISVWLVATTCWLSPKKRPTSNRIVDELEKIVAPVSKDK